MSAHRFIHDRDQAEFYLSDPGNGAALPVDRTGTIVLHTGGSGETNSLPDPKQADLELTIVCRSHGGGDRVVTAVSPLNSDGDHILTFGAANDWAKLFSIEEADGTFVWRIMCHDLTSLLAS